MYKGIPSLVVQRPMQVHYKGDEIVPSELVTLVMLMVSVTTHKYVYSTCDIQHCMSVFSQKMHL